MVRFGCPHPCPTSPRAYTPPVHTKSLLTVLSLLTVPTARAEEPTRLLYRTYAIGLHIADAEGVLGSGPWTYQIGLSFRTVGVARAIFAGQQTNAVRGTWNAHIPQPEQYRAAGIWRGEDRTTLIDYTGGIPVVRQLLPPLEPERETVPEALRANTTDTLSALAALVRAVARTGSCETILRIFDGRRLAEIVARSAGETNLEPTSRSVFAGPALRCDFVSRVLAGFRPDEGSKTDYRPLRGSAWIGRIAVDGPPIPVRLTIETRWFGDATSYLTEVSRGGP